MDIIASTFFAKGAWMLMPFPGKLSGKIRSRKLRKDLYWLNGPWRGKLAIAARPRGGDWLRDDLANWKRAGIESVFSLLTPEEEADLDLLTEASEVKAQGMVFASFPIPDRQIPKSEAELADLLEMFSRSLSEGKNVVVHCRGGIGRSGLIAASLLVRKGISPGAAVELVSAARGVTIPETSEQREWIDQYAATLTSSK
jgi:protein-tyrosine phosphatase